MSRFAFPLVPLGEVAKPIVRPVEVVPGQSYRTLGVKWWGEGAYERETIDGSKIAAKQLYRVHEGDLIINKIWVRHGSIGIVPASMHGCAGSGEFPTFDLDSGRVLARWIHWYSKRPEMWAKCDALSQGTSGKNRIKPEKFLTVTVPLPPLSEQRRIVADIEQLASKIEKAKGLRKSLATRTQGLFDSAARHAFPVSGRSRVGDCVKVQSGYAFKSEWFAEEGIRLVRNVNIGHGTLDWTDTARISADCTGEFGRFELVSGDILVSLDRPIISTGIKVARVRKEDLPSLLLQRVGRLLFVDDRVDPDYMFHWLKSPCFSEAIDPGRSNGVPHISQKDIERISFSVAPLPEQRRIVAYLDDLQAKVDQLKASQAQTAAELDALLPSILDKAFRGEL